MTRFEELRQAGEELHQKGLTTSEVEMAYEIPFAAEQLDLSLTSDECSLIYEKAYDAWHHSDGMTAACMIASAAVELWKEHGGRAGFADVDWTDVLLYYV